MNEQDPQVPKIEPYNASMEGWSPHPNDLAPMAPDWPNTVSIRVVTGWDAPALDDSEDYADIGDQRELVEIDTNYKDTRPGDHPVRLTRTAALELAGHIITATEDTFHFARVGRLRATEAAELLHTLDRVQAALQNLREHALHDLLHDTGIDIDA